MKCEICKKKIEQQEKKDIETEFFERWADESYCLEAVKRNGDSLQYVKEQTEAICLEAVKQDGDSLRYVKERRIWESIRRAKK